MLQVKAIEKYYGSKNHVTKALDRISFDVAEGERSEERRVGKECAA